MAILQFCWRCAWCHPKTVVWLAEPSGRFASAPKLATVMACHSQICTGSFLSVQQLAALCRCATCPSLLDITHMQTHAGVIRCVAVYCIAYVVDHGSVTLLSTYNTSTAQIGVAILNSNHVLDHVRTDRNAASSVHTREKAIPALHINGIFASSRCKSQKQDVRCSNNTQKALLQSYAV